jgi:hypothetical protein
MTDGGLSAHEIGAPLIPCVIGCPFRLCFEICKPAGDELSDCLGSRNLVFSGISLKLRKHLWRKSYREHGMLARAARASFSHHLLYGHC